MTAGYNVAKLFTSVIYKCSKQAIVFVPGKPRMMFVSKARAYPSEASFRCSTKG